MEIRNEGGIGPNDAVTSLNGLTGDITLAAGTGITITPAGQILTIASTADLSVTLADVSANSLTAPNSLYTMTSTIPVEFRRSGGSTLLYLDETNGRIGIGLNNPNRQLTIVSGGDTVAELRGGTTSTGAYINLINSTGGASGTAQFYKVGSSYVGYKTIGVNDFGFYNGTGGNIAILNDNATGNINFATGGVSTAQMVLTSAGNVGIGTTSPQFALHISKSDTTTFSNANVWNGVGKAVLQIANLSSTTDTYAGIVLSGGANNNSFSAINMVQEIGNSRGNLVFSTGGNATTTSLERMRISGDGNVGIGTTAPQNPLHVVTSSATQTMRLDLFDATNADLVTFVSRRGRGTAASPAAVNANDALGGLLGGGYYTGGSFSGYSGAIKIYSSQAYTSTNQGSYITFETTPDNSTTRAERMRIYSAGGVNIVSAGGGSAGGGGIAIGNGGAPTYGLELSGNEPYVSAIQNTLYANTNYPDWVTRKSRGTKASPTTVVTGDTLGHFAFQGNVGAGTANFQYGADIGAVVNGSATTSGIATDLVFKTSTASAQLVEALRITSAGIVQPGTNNTQDFGVSGTAWKTGYFGTSVSVPVVVGGSGTGSTLILQTTTGVGASGADMIFRGGNNGATEFMRILNAGNVGIGLSNPNGFLDIKTGSNRVFTFIDNGSVSSMWATTIGGGAFNSMKIDGTTLLLNSSSGGNVGIKTTSPASTLDVNGSFAVAYVAKTATYTATGSDHTIDCTSGTFTVNLPTAVGITGRKYVIKNSGVGVITIDANGTETIDGALTQTLSTQYASYMIQSTGANWIII